MTHSNPNPVWNVFDYFKSKCCYIVDKVDFGLHKGHLILITLFGDDFAGVSDPNVIGFEFCREMKYFLVEKIFGDSYWFSNDIAIFLELYFHVFQARNCQIYDFSIRILNQVNDCILCKLFVMRVVIFFNCFQGVKKLLQRGLHSS